MWAEKDSPLHWTPKHAHTHTRGREGGGDRSRHTGTMLSWYPVLGIVQSVLHLNPWRKYSFKIHLNFSGNQLFWYTNCIGKCILLCREYVIILFKAIFIYTQKQQYTSVGVHSMFCSKCTRDLNVDRIGQLLTYESQARTHA